VSRSRLAVREAAPSDLPALTELERAAFPEPWSRAGLAAFVGRPGALVLVGEAPRRANADRPAEGAAPPVAYGVWTIAADEAELLRLAVVPARRRQGLARALLAAAAGRLAAADCTTCFLEVRADNRSAIALYEGAGFHRIGRRRAYYGDGADALLYAASVGRPAPPPHRAPGGAARG